MTAREIRETITMLKTLKTLSQKSGKNTTAISVNMDSFNFVINEAIKALEQQIKQEAYVVTGMLPIEELKHLEEQMKKARLQLISEKQEPCYDAISRQSVKQELQGYCDFIINAYGCGCLNNLAPDYKARVTGITDCIAAVENEPSIGLQPKIGYWIRVDKGKFKCSECDIVHFIEQYPMGNIDWCPNCGTKMRSKMDIRVYRCTC